VVSRIWCVGVFIVTLAVPALPASAQSPASPDKSNVVTVSTKGKTWTGDLDELLKHRAIRIVAPYSKTMYYVVNGAPQGVTYELGKAFENYCNLKYPQKTKNIRLHVIMIARPRDKLLPSVNGGLADIAAAALAITPERQKLVDFSDPLAKGVNQIVVTGPASPKLASLDDLAGQEVFLRRASSEWENVERLNERFQKEHKAAVKLRALPEDLEDEDALEMVNAGLLSITIVKDLIANAWSKVYTKLQLHPDIAVSTDDKIAWAMRKNSPQLMAVVNDFVKTHRAESGFGATLLKKYGATAKLKDATSPAAMKQFEDTAAMFRKYSAEQSMDYLLMMAEGFQESGLKQSANSAVGAIGVMQLMPATGEEMKVGDVHEEDAHIHAGIKFFRSMVDRYYGNEPNMDDLNKVLFTFAAYNCGPGRVKKLRAEAAQKGLDPNVWLDNVEIITAERVGTETVNYVSNIYKYYVAYKLIAAEDEERRKAKESLQKKAS